MGDLLGYVRVGTTHPDLDRQLDALSRHGIAPVSIYQDKKTGATIERPGFNELLRYARPGSTTAGPSRRSSPPSPGSTNPSPQRKLHRRRRKQVSGM